MDVTKRRIGHLSWADVDYVSKEVMEKKVSNVLYGQHIWEEAVSERDTLDAMQVQDFLQFSTTVYFRIVIFICELKWRLFVAFIFSCWPT